ncbi:hypothetical protein LTR29_006961 [Friedmanniomyces endolithicus]|nr:hypothetical protein LTR29_006961 [Friedmanniomyces endolithicus]
MSATEDSMIVLSSQRLTSQPLQIRLLRLAQASSAQLEDDLHCDLQTFDLEKAPPYRCVTYCWGKSEWCPIGVTSPSSPDKSMNYRVTKNLLRCLQQLRESVKQGLLPEGFLWVDAICINQNDDIEKLDQIENMGAIYSGAQLVIAWLGWDFDRRGDATDQEADAELMDEDPADRAIVAIREIAVALRSWSAAGGEVWGAQLSSLPFDDKRCYEMLRLRPVPRRTWNAIAIFLKREWWSRAWVCQEVILARGLTLLCGSHSLEFDDILQTCIFLHASDWYVPLQIYTSTQLGRGTIGGQCLYFGAARTLFTPASANLAVYGPADNQRVRDLFDDDRERLTLLVTRVKIYKTSEPRDKVLVPLALERHVKGAAQDLSPLKAHDANVRSLYVQMTAHLLTMSSGLALLSHVEDGSLRKLEDLPSWCPDYSVSVFSPPFGDMVSNWYDALPLREKSCCVDIATQTLTLEGHAVDKISRLGPSVLSASAKDFLEFCLTLNITYHNKQDRVEALWRTLIADHLSDVSPLPAGVSALFAAWLLHSVANSILGNNDTDGPPPHKDWSDWSCFDELRGSSAAATAIIPSTTELAAHTELMRARRVESKDGVPEAKELRGPHDAYQSSFMWVGGRILFVTASGSIGLAPPATKVGDQAWLVSGAKVPFILRPAEDGSHHKLVGEAYVHGYMHGEAVERMQNAQFQKVMLR